MIKIESSVVINRPVDEVFEFLANSENDPQWQSGVLEVRKTSEGPLGVGTTYTSVSRLLGRQLESVVEYTAYEQNKRLAGKATSGPIPFQFETSFEPAAEGGTTVTTAGEGEVGGFFKLAEPVVARMLKRQFETDSANLKDLLEAQD
jgi:uncharacterized membrane protein